jgi:PAS domain S-box-containing protein
MSFHILRYLFGLSGIKPHTAPPPEIFKKNIDKLDALFAHSTGMISFHDDDGVLRYVVGGVHNLLGVKAEDVIGSRIDDYVHPDDRLTILHLWSHLSRGGNLLESEFRLLRADGAIVWVEAVFSEITYRGGQNSSVKFACTITDITRRRLAESDLRKVRDDLASSIAAGQGTLYRLTQGKNGKWQPVFFASNIERITGYGVEDAMRPGWIEGILSLPNRSQRQAAQNTAITEGEATAEYDFPTRAGSVIRVRDHMRRWDRSDGTIELVGYMLDITDSYFAERKLLDAQHELAAIVASSPGVLYRFVINQHNEYEDEFISETAVRIFGLPANRKLKVADWREWARRHIDPVGQVLFSKPLEKILRDGKSSCEYRFIGPDGSWRWARDISRSIPRSDGKSEIVGYSADITEEKALANQLAQANKLATLGEMATGMAHELSQPLAGISMAAENALIGLNSPTIDSEQIQKKLQRISDQALRAAKLIDHMRIFGRRDPGEAEPVDIAAALDGALLIAQGRLRATRTFVKSRIEPDLVPVRGSMMLMEQVLINLIGNACDAYMDAHPPIPYASRRIEITVSRTETGLRVTVADHAGGIHGPDIERIFEPFFTTKPAGKGTGLGLSITYGIVSDMGGSINARNQDGGAVFEVDLPRYKSETLSVDSKVTSI